LLTSSGVIQALLTADSTSANSGSLMWPDRDRQMRVHSPSGPFVAPSLKRVVSVLCPPLEIAGHRRSCSSTWSRAASALRAVDELVAAS
jgi:hypothetical protein